MTPRELDPATVQRRLISLRELLDQLVAHDHAQLEADARDRHATLWVMTQLVSVAAGASAHLTAALLGRAPATQRESFEAVVEAGVVDPELLDDLRAACGMRNVLVHEYGDVDLGLVAASIPSAQQVFDAYIQQVAAFLDDRADDRADDGAATH